MSIKDTGERRLLSAAICGCDRRAVWYVRIGVAVWTSGRKRGQDRNAEVRKKRVSHGAVTDT
jgi:hypothetical protein